MGIFAWQAPLNTLTGHSRKKSTFKSTNLGRGEGGLRISTLCTNRKMLTIVNGPLCNWLETNFIFPDGLLCRNLSGE